MNTNLKNLIDFNQRWESDPEKACGDHVANEFVCHEPPNLPQGGIFRGQTAPMEISKLYRSLWDVEFTDVQFYETGDTNIIFGHYQTTWTSKETGKSLTQPIAELFEFKNSKLIRMEVFHFDPEGLCKTLK